MKKTQASLQRWLNFESTEMMQGSTRDQMKEPGNGRKLMLATAITLSFAGVEAAAGWWSGSLALISDAGHMVTDSAALLIAALAGWIARRRPSPKHSYGFGRAQLVAALVNGLFMLAVVTAIIVQAVARFTNPIGVNGEAVTVVASLGLLLNIFVARMLSHGGRDLNVRGALLHVLGDLLGSVAALLSGAIIWTTGWFAVDPALSLIIALLIAYSSLKLAREAFHGLMEGVPLHLSLEEIGKTMADVEGSNIGSRSECLRSLLAQRYGIEHVTLQPEISGQTRTGAAQATIEFVGDDLTAQRTTQGREH